MKLFKIKNWQVQVEEEVWTLQPFKVLLDRDKTKDKEIAMKEMAFIYHFSDVKSDYVYIGDKDDRESEIKKDIGLPKKWKADSKIKAAIDFYIERSVTPSERLYKAGVKSANDIATYLNNTGVLLAERDEKGKPVNTINSITGALKGIPDIMKNLSNSYKALIKEKEDLENKSKGSQQMGMFENGL